MYLHGIGPGLNISYGEFVGLLSAFIWALHSLLLRTQVHKASPILLNAFRCFVASVFFWCLLPFGEPLSAYGAVTAVEWLLLVGAVVLVIGIGDTLHMIAIREIGVSRSMAVSGVHPITTLVFERLLLGTPFSEGFVAGCGLVVLGIALLSGRGQADTGGEGPQRLVYGVVLALIAALCWGLGTVVTKPAIVNMTPVQANSIRMPLVALVLLLSYRFSGQAKGGAVGLRDLGGRTLAYVGGIGILGMGFGSLTFLVALELVGPAKTALLAGISPVLALVLAVAFLKEKVNWAIILGVGLCSAGVWLVL